MTDVSIAGLFDELSFQGHGKLGLWFEVIDREQAASFLTILMKTFQKMGKARQFHSFLDSVYKD